MAYWRRAAGVITAYSNLLLSVLQVYSNRISRVSKPNKTERSYATRKSAGPFSLAGTHIVGEIAFFGMSIFPEQKVFSLFKRTKISKLIGMLWKGCGAMHEPYLKRLL